MNKRLLTVALLAGAWSSYAQVGVGTLTPNTSSQLDVVAKDKGILIPRLMLTSITDTTTVTTGSNGSYENGLLVFNTNTENDITPGYYYWYVDKWMRIVNQEDVLAIDTNTTNASLQVVNGILILMDSDGAEVSIPLSAINLPESQTSLVHTTDKKNQYYIAEEYLSNTANPAVTQTIIDGWNPLSLPTGVYPIDVVGGVVNNIQDIVNNGPVTINGNTYTTIEEYLQSTNVAGTVKIVYDNTTGDAIFQEWNETTNTWVNVDNSKFETIVKANETVTQLVKNTDGTYTYYNETEIDATTGNPSGTGVTIDVAKGTLGTDAATLGLVKEAVTNPTVAVSQTGELSVNLENLNAIKEVSTDYTVTLEDAILLGNANGGDITMTLPSAVGNKGKKFTIKKQDANEDYYVNVLGSINGLTDLYTALPHSGWDLVSDGSTWKIVNKF